MRLDHPEWYGKWVVVTPRWKEDTPESVKAEAREGSTGYEELLVYIEWEVHLEHTGEVEVVVLDNNPSTYVY